MAHHHETNQRSRRHHDIDRAHRRHRTDRHPHVTRPDQQARAHGLSWLSL